MIATSPASACRPTTFSMFAHPCRPGRITETATPSRPDPAPTRSSPTRSPTRHRRFGVRPPPSFLAYIAITGTIRAFSVLRRHHHPDHRRDGSAPGVLPLTATTISPSWGRSRYLFAALGALPAPACRRRRLALSLVALALRAGGIVRHRADVRTQRRLQPRPRVGFAQPLASPWPRRRRHADFEPRASFTVGVDHLRGLGARRRLHQRRTGLRRGRAGRSAPSPCSRRPRRAPRRQDRHARRPTAISHRAPPLTFGHGRARQPGRYPRPTALSYTVRPLAGRARRGAERCPSWLKERDWKSRGRG